MTSVSQPARGLALGRHVLAAGSAGRLAGTGLAVPLSLDHRSRSRNSIAKSSGEEVRHEQVEVVGALDRHHVR